MSQKPSEHLTTEWNRANAIWRATESTWHDKTRKDFQEKHWQPISHSVARLTKDISSLEKALDAILKECP